MKMSEAFSSYYKLPPGDFPQYSPNALGLLLRKSATQGRKDMMIELFELASNTAEYINKGDEKNEYTALMCAAGGGHIECFVLLIEHKARVHQICKSKVDPDTKLKKGGHTALVIAILRNQEAILIKYVELFGPPSYFDPYGASAFEQAVEKKLPQVLSKLISLGLDITSSIDKVSAIQESDPAPPLAQVYYGRNTCLIETLVEHGCLSQAGPWEIDCLNDSIRIYGERC